MRTDEGICFFLFVDGSASYLYGHEETKEYEYHFGMKPQLKIYQSIEWINLEFSWGIPYMNSEMDRPLFHYNNS